MKINRKSAIVAISIIVIISAVFVGGVKYGQIRAVNNAYVYTAEDVTGAYNVGYEDGLLDASTIS